MFLRPFANLLACSRRSSVAVRPVAVGCLEEPLVLAFELVIEDDSMDARAIVLEPFRGAKVGPIKLRVMRKLARLHFAGVVRLLFATTSAFAMTLQHFTTTIGQRDECCSPFPIERSHRAYQPCTSQPFEIAMPYVAGPTCVVA